MNLGKELSSFLFSVFFIFLVLSSMSTSSNDTENKERTYGSLLFAFVTINKKLPGPQVPFESHRYNVKNIDRAGAIKIDNDKNLVLAGVECREDIQSMLNSYFPSDSEKVIYSPISHKNNQIVAYVWLVDEDSKDDENPESPGFGNLFMSLNEMALLDGWCSPVKMPGHQYHDRYFTISKLREYLEKNK
jgi:hypothetical protein